MNNANKMQFKLKRTRNNIDGLLNNLEEGEIGMILDKGGIVTRDSDNEPCMCKFTPVYSYFKANTVDNEQYGVYINPDLNEGDSAEPTMMCDSDTWYRLNTEDITSTIGMFFNSTATTYDLSRFCTDNVTQMAEMFAVNSSLTSLDLSHFNTSNVTNMMGMFLYDIELTDLNIITWDISNVINISHMFAGCSKLTSLDLSNFDTFKVTDMNNMFKECQNLSSLNLCSFDTFHVTYMYNMFVGCENLRDITLNPNFFKTTQEIPFDGAQNLGFSEGGKDNGWLEHLATIAPQITDGKRRTIKLYTNLKNASWAAPHLATLQSKNYTIA